VQPNGPGEVGAGVGAPLADEGDDLRLPLAHSAPISA
jgi:hypothetical protein